MHRVVEKLAALGERGEEVALRATDDEVVADDAVGGVGHALLAAGRVAETDALVAVDDQVSLDDGVFRPHPDEHGAAAFARLAANVAKHVVGDNQAVRAHQIHAAHVVVAVVVWVLVFVGIVPHLLGPVVLEQAELDAVARRPGRLAVGPRRNLRPLHVALPHVAAVDVAERDLLRPQVAVDLDPVLLDVLHGEIGEQGPLAAGEHDPFGVPAAGEIEHDFRPVTTRTADRNVVGILNHERLLHLVDARGDQDRLSGLEGRRGLLEFGNVLHADDVSRGRGQGRRRRREAGAGHCGTPGGCPRSSWLPHLGGPVGRRLGPACRPIEHLGLDLHHLVQVEPAAEQIAVLRQVLGRRRTGSEMVCRMDAVAADQRAQPGLARLPGEDLTVVVHQRQAVLLRQGHEPRVVGPDQARRVGLPRRHRRDHRDRAVGQALLVDRLHRLQILLHRHLLTGVVRTQEDDRDPRVVVFQDGVKRGQAAVSARQALFGRHPARGGPTAARRLIVGGQPPAVGLVVLVGSHPRADRDFLGRPPLAAAGIPARRIGVGDRVADRHDLAGVACVLLRHGRHRRWPVPGILHDVGGTRRRVGHDPDSRHPCQMFCHRRCSGFTRPSCPLSMTRDPRSLHDPAGLGKFRDGRSTVVMVGPRRGRQGVGHVPSKGRPRRPS